MSPKAMLLPVAMFTNLNLEPDLQGIGWLVAKFSKYKLLEPTSSLKKNVLPILTDNYLKGLGHASLGKLHIDQPNTKFNKILQ